MTNGNHTQNSRNDKSQLTSAEKRLGLEHGNDYAFFPRQFRKQQWLFKKLMIPGEIILTIMLWSYEGDEGIFPTLGTMSEELAISRPNLSRMLKELNRDDKLKCPMCQHLSPAISIEKIPSNYTLKRNSYDLKPIEDFMTHVQKHVSDKEDEEIKERYKDINKHRYQSNFPNSPEVVLPDLTIKR
jgi:DNA-binding MarR family transcriptional regulator